MIENQAYIVALMLLIASPIAIASDEGQAVLERFSNTPDDLVDVEKNDRTEALDNLLEEDILNDIPTDERDTKDIVEDCYTLEQWKESLADYDWNKEDWEQESDEVREESNDGARGNSDDKKEDYNKETDKVTDKDCFTEAQFEEFVDKISRYEKEKKDYEEDCVTIAQFRERLAEIRGIDHDYEHDWEEDDRDDESDEDNVAADNTHDNERDQKDGDDSRCINKHMVDHMKEKFGRDRGHKDYDRDWNRDQDWERDDDKECDERDEDDENDHDEEDEDDSEDEEDDSGDDEPENA
jgi:topoisomerase-4 subunit A